MTKLEQLKAVYEAATPGEWARNLLDEGLIYGADEDGDYLICDVVGDPEHAVSEQDTKNAEFIALAHNLMPALLEAMQLLQEVTDYAVFATYKDDPLPEEVVRACGLLEAFSPRSEVEA